MSLAADPVAELQRDQRHEMEIALQAEQTRIMQEQLNLQKRQAELAQRTRDDEALRHHKESVRRQKAQQFELDRELDRQLLEYLRNKQSAEAPRQSSSATDFSDAVKASVLKAQAAYSFAKEGDPKFEEFATFLEGAQAAGIIRQSPGDWPMLTATEFAAQRGILRNGMQPAPQPQGQVFTAFNLDNSGPPRETRIYTDHILKPGEKALPAPPGYRREVTAKNNGYLLVNDVRISN